MAKTYRPYVPEQDLLLAPSLRNWLPENDLAYFVTDLMNQWICRRSRPCMKTKNEATRMNWSSDSARCRPR
jgi:hypothetical protein